MMRKHMDAMSHTHTQTHTWMLALPSFSAAGFGKRSPSSLGQHEGFNNSHVLTSQNSVQAPDQMQHKSLDGQPGLGD